MTALSLNIILKIQTPIDILSCAFSGVNILPELYRSVYELIDKVQLELAEFPVISDAFKKCYPNTLETTVNWLNDETAFVVTGDIPAMWLRDSTCQVRPYVGLAARDADVKLLIEGLIKRQVAYILHDPYANAFNEAANGRGYQDQTVQSALVWERKFELDSLCYPLQLCQDYFAVTGDSALFDESIHQMFWTVLQVLRCEQRHDKDSAYTFIRTHCPPSDTLAFGRGTPTNFTGMVWSGFRPSDDACKFGFLIPSNMFAVVCLSYVAKIANDVYHDRALANEASSLRQDIEFGIETYGIVNHPDFGRIYAYETDGFGNYNLMDDANVPSLLSIPYLGYRSTDDPVYQSTRRFVLSQENPYFFTGQAAMGIGSPHTPIGHIWPISLIMQGLTSTDLQEQLGLIQTLVSTTAGTEYMHESFHANDPSFFTRPWFAWANSLFGQFILHWLANKGRLAEVVMPK